MKIYVAHNFDARLDLREIIYRYFKHHEVTSTWIYDDSHALGGQTRQASARVDIEDIERADCFLLFVDQFGERTGRGKWVEWGYALGIGKKIILVGEDEGCIFYHLEHANISRFKSIQAAIKSLEGR
jgi:nucleoside 2-deoxyribosyltransferase